MLLALSLNAVEKKVQGRVAAATNSSRGVPSGIFDSNNHPMNAITDSVSNGRMMLHNTPIAVCLYRTSKSRQARK
jgi:hypothetical protein